MWKKQTKGLIKRTSLIVFCINGLIIIALAFFIYHFVTDSIKKDTVLRLQNIAYLGAKSIDGDAFLRLREQTKKDMTPEESEKVQSSEDFKKVYEELNAIRQADPKIIKYVYTFVPTEDENEARFVVDGDFFDDLQNQSESITPFWEDYNMSNQPVTQNAVKNPVNVVDANFSYDEPYKTYVISGFAPIFDSQNRFVGTFWVDISDENLAEYINNVMYLLASFAGLAILIALWVAMWLNQHVINLGFVMREKEELQETLKKQKDLDAKKTNFLNIASHELRAPLTVINGYLSMATEGDFWEMNDELRKYITIAGRNTAYLLSLVNDMLDISKLDAKKEEFKPEEFKLSETIDKIIDTAQFLGKEKGLQIINDFRLDINEIIYACKGAIIKILTNIMGNATKFTSTGGFVKLTVDRDEKNHIFIIEDNGIGIEKSDFEKIFEKFWQVGHSLNKQAKGTGLGLYIAQKNAHAISGEITLESTVGKGTTFTIRIPIIYPPKAEN